MKLFRTTLAAAGLLALSAGAVEAANAYAYQTGVSNPWGQTTNNAAMDAAFGAGNWDLFQGFSISAFSGATRFVFLDGSDDSANQLNTFLTANIAAIEAFVSGGGSVFINAAPNEGGNIAAGFGGVVINYSASVSSAAKVDAAGVAAGLTDGGITDTYTGTLFSHAAISGPVSSLIFGQSGIILGGLDFGSGYALFGGQTTTNFHSPSADAFQLRVNQLLFAASQADGDVAVPAPGALALLGFGLLGLLLVRRLPAA